MKGMGSAQILITCKAKNLMQEMNNLYHPSNRRDDRSQIKSTFYKSPEK